MAAFVQALLTAGRSGALGGPLTLTGSKTVKGGNRIFLLVAATAPANSYSVTDNLGSVYQQMYEYETGGLTNSENTLFTAQVASSGTLTTQTVNYTGVITEIVATSCEFSGVSLAINQVTNGAGGGTSGGVTGVANSGALQIFTTVQTNFSSAPTGFTPPSGYTVAFDNAAPDTFMRGQLSYAIGLPPSSSPTGTWTGGAEWTAVHSNVPQNNFKYFTGYFSKAAVLENTVTTLDIFDQLDPWAWHSDTVNKTRIIVPDDGYYLIFGHAHSFGTVGSMTVTYKRNGVDVYSQTCAMNLVAGIGGTRAVYAQFLAAGDYIEFTVIHNSGATRDINGYARVLNLSTSDVCIASSGVNAIGCCEVWSASLPLTQVEDTNSMYDNSNPSRITAKTTGKYLCFWMQRNEGAGREYWGRVLINGTEYARQKFLSGANRGPGMALLMNLTAGDYVEMQAATNYALSGYNTTDGQLALFLLGSLPSAHLQHSVNTSFSAAGINAPFDTEDFDTDGFHDTVTNNSRLTIPSGLGGTYLSLTNSRGNAFTATTEGFKVNGTEAGTSWVKSGGGSDAGGWTSGIFGIDVRSMSVADYITNFMTHNQGSNQTGYKESTRLGFMKVDDIAYVPTSRFVPQIYRRL